MQNNPMPTGSMIEPETAPKFAPSAPGVTPMNTGAQLTSDNKNPGDGGDKKVAHNTLIETILLVIACLVAIVFVWLYVQKFIAYESIATDLDNRVDAAVAVAVAENTTKMEAEFEEREKFPYLEFSGPEDYGRFSFQYPRTWSVYIARDAASGGDFEAYFNPVEVYQINSSNVYALRMKIRNASFDSVVKSYESSLKNGKLALKTQMVGGVLANIYTGTISNNIRGAVMVLKVRDKTVILQTDADLFMDDFFRLLETVTLVE